MCVCLRVGGEGIVLKTDIPGGRNSACEVPAKRSPMQVQGFEKVCVMGALKIEVENCTLLRDADHSVPYKPSVPVCISGGNSWHTQIMVIRKIQGRLMKGLFTRCRQGLVTSLRTVQYPHPSNSGAQLSA